MILELHKQESKYHAEKCNIEVEIISILDELVNVDWDSNPLKYKIQELMKQRFCVEQQLYKLNESPFTQPQTVTGIKNKTRSKLTRHYLNKF